MPSRNIKSIVVAVLIGAFVLMILLPNLIAPTLEDPAIRQARAMLNPGAPENERPAVVTLTLDGATAIFHRGDAQYAALLSALQAIKSKEAMEKAGPIPSYDPRVCGSMVIKSFGIAWEFRLARSRTDPHYLWLRLPHLNRGGYGLPLLYDDDRLAPLIQGAAKP